ncbi:ATP-binding protein [Actinomadura roseirufa]|uniref:ATP-binding protein n=1 Tax=Actinomadura roseirufa TaxID=2094049 RepID=UPI00104135A2|nr:LuxR family transcriptional regulator [Actinomadura roseirufa]
MNAEGYGKAAASKRSARGLLVALIGRDDELAALESLPGAFAQAGSKVVMISGGIATGKTTLLRTLGDRAIDSGALYLGAVASRVERNLPLGVLEQLFRSPALPAASAERAMHWLEVGARVTSMREPLTGSAGHVPTSVLRGLWEVLRDLVERQPVVLGVDDVHYADDPSLQCLLYLVRRLRSARLHVIFSECSHLRIANALLQSEFLREPFFQQIRLEPLSKSAVADMLAGQLDDRAAQDLTTAVHEASAGYPLLVQALIDDYRAGAHAAAGEMLAGEAFGRAVLRFLYRYEPPIIEVARATAVLGKPASIGLLGRLLDMDAAATLQAVNMLTTAEVLVNGCFRHDAFRVAILEGTPPTALRTTHGRIADLLHNEGAPATEVAAHIVAADHITAPWVIPILQEAAEHALAADEVATGIRYLRAAYQMCDERQRPVITSALAEAEWRVDPATVLRRLHEFGAPLDGEPVEGRDSLAPVTYLLWHGRVDEAVDILDGLTRAPHGTADHGAATAGDYCTSRLWGAYLYPGFFSRPPDPLPAFARQGPEPMNPDLQDAGLLAAELAQGNEVLALAAAEAILQRSRLNHRTFAPLTAALAVLTYNDRLDQAAAWSDFLLAEAAERHSPTWEALVTAQRALIHVRQGNLVAAVDLAETALHLIPPKSWGVAVGLPLAAMVLAATAMGNVRQAATYLDIPVPEAMFQTRMGLHYLYARGRYHLATSRAYAALSDFCACGRLMGEWGLDLPALEAWRSGAIEAYLLLGEPHKAERLGAEQAALVCPGQPRTRGLALRSQAATRDPEARPALLEEAVEVLQGSGDRLGLAYALAEESRARQVLGEHEQARTLARKADALARKCRARIPEQPGTVDRIDGGPVVPENESTPFTVTSELSDAERRVATLAAAGHTNREISKRLYITVSTVEQHLTRIYRKLNVKRFDLRAALQYSEIDVTVPERVAEPERYAVAGKGAGGLRPRGLAGEVPCGREGVFGYEGRPRPQAGHNSAACHGGT